MSYFVQSRTSKVWQTPEFLEVSKITFGQMPYICICYKVKVWTNGAVRLRPSPQQLCRFQTQNFAKSPTSYRVQTPTNTLLCIGCKHQILTNSLIHLGGNLLIFTNAILFIDSNYQILKIPFLFFLFFFFFFCCKIKEGYFN